ncbi:MAG: EAL domain-containing protein (putative c-di-GMP-specific phosphodiesterase class I) [Nitrospinales bacterium]|jgi:EAL domain-containing protein (putative c-di-GMP-specific phosphodiesterase class I)
MLMRTKSYLERALGLNIARGLEVGEFSVYYQPQWDLFSKTVTGFEALARWHAPGYGQISPSEFIPIAESTGGIQELGEWVLLTACGQAKRWQKSATQPFLISVNVSGHQLEQKDFAARIIDILSITGFAPEYLELEITESVFLHNLPAIHHSLDCLRKEGVRFALDDFGMGYSSIHHLSCLPLDCLKIDQSFVRSLDSAQTRTVVKAMANLASELGMRTVVEGVQDDNEEFILWQLGLNQGQGYKLSPPVPAESAVHFLI